MCKLLIVLLLTTLSIQAGDTNTLSKIDQELKLIRYEAKTYSTTNIITSSTIERLSQPVEVTRWTGKGNCGDLAVYAKKLAEKEGLKATYIVEPKHVAVRIVDKNGAAYRYSNGKNRGRCW